MKAMILAAGLGSRMRPLTNNCPKPLLLVAGKPLIVHHIEQLVQLGITEIIINHAYLGHMIEEALGDGRQFGCQIQYSAEQEALETGGGIYNALPLLTDNGTSNQPFLLVNGDVWLEWQQLVLPSHIEGLCHLWLVENPAHNPDGDFVLTPSLAVLEKPNSELGQATHQGTFDRVLTFSGVSIISPKLFNDAQSGAFPLAPLLRQAMKEHQASGEMLSGQWVDVGTPERLKYVEQLISEQL